MSFDFDSINRGNAATGTLPTNAQCVSPVERNENYDSLSIAAIEAAMDEYDTIRPGKWSSDRGSCFMVLAHFRLKYNGRTGKYCVDHCTGEFPKGYRGSMEIVKEWFQISGSVYWETSADAPGISPTSPMLNYVSRLDALRGAVERAFNEYGDRYREGELDAPCFGGMTSTQGRDKLNQSGSRLKENLRK
ncbi:MAG: hypothetical protein GY818_13360 [Planctomycetaceae bacterium]|nr:hypothetical protein [Planctomycetaceae bacterium]